jgi:hypothetical protein
MNHSTDGRTLRVEFSKEKNVNTLILFWGTYLLVTVGTYTYLVRMFG